MKQRASSPASLAAVTDQKHQHAGRFTHQRRQSRAVKAWAQLLPRLPAQASCVSWRAAAGSSWGEALAHQSSPSGAPALLAAPQSMTASLQLPRSGLWSGGTGKEYWLPARVRSRTLLPYPANPHCEGTSSHHFQITEAPRPGALTKTLLSGGILHQFTPILL